MMAKAKEALMKTSRWRGLGEHGPLASGRTEYSGRGSGLGNGRRGTLSYHVEVWMQMASQDRQLIFELEHTMGSLVIIFRPSPA
jgi:hypothetical protein